MLGAIYRLSLFLTIVVTISSISYGKTAEDDTYSEHHLIQKRNTGQTLAKPIIRAYSISTNIKYRYAMTVISNKVQNPENTSQEFTFNAILPETAFVSSFSMTIKGRTYRSFVAEKENATKIYKQEKDKGRAASHVHLLARDSNTIAVSVNIEPMEKVVFNLTYEECLQRENEFYLNRLIINPGEVVDELNVFVNIKESPGIKIIQVSDLRSGNEVSSSFTQSKIAQISRPSEDTAEVKWNPSVEEQKRVSKYGVSGQIIIRYDVDRDKEPNRILFHDGYFVHFLTKSSAQKLPNYLIFILDVSWSMGGTRLEQLKEAMYRILEEIDRTDFFTVITFSTDVQVWSSDQITEKLTNPEGKHIIKANEFNVRIVTEYIKQLQYIMYTNSIAGLRTGVNLAKLGKKLLPDAEPIIFFLTDGEANHEEPDVNVITRKITELNQDVKCPIFSLAFGMEASFPFLANLSLSNFGFARKIYIASDAFLQLTNFYKQISRIILSNVSFHYIPEQIESMTNTNFDKYFDGSAIMAAGKLAPGIQAENLNVSATARYLRNDNYVLPKPVVVAVTDGNLERLYAFMSIKQFLEKSTGDPSLKKKALALSIQYSFVTPLTSLVVVKPESEQQGLRSKREAYSIGSARCPYYSPSGYYTYNSIGAPFGSLGRTRYFAKKTASGLNGCIWYKTSTSLLPVTTTSTPSIKTSTLPTTTSTPSIKTSTLPTTTSTPSIKTSTLPTTTSTPSIKTSTLPTTTSIPDVPTIPVAVEIKSEKMVDVVIKNVTWLGSMIYLPNYHFSGMVETNEPNTPYQDCVLPNTAKGRCRYIKYCVMPEIINSLDDYLPYSCIINNKYAGICCPETGAL